MSKPSAQEIAKLRRMLQTGIDVTNAQILNNNPSPNPKHVPTLRSEPPKPKMWVGENGTYPAPATDGSAGYDLHAAVNVTVPAGETVMVSTEIRMSIPSGFGGFIFSRSGLGVKKGLSVAQGVGVVDSDYRGEIFVPLYNRTDKDYDVTKGDAIAQMVFLPYAMIVFTYVDSPDQLDETERGEGGFGSTDKTEEA